VDHLFGPERRCYYRATLIRKAVASASGVQRGSVGFMFQFPAIRLHREWRLLPGCRIRSACLRGIGAVAEDSVTPLSYADASPILEHLGGRSRRASAGALPFTYHVGRARENQDAPQAGLQFRTIWDVVAKFAERLRPMSGWWRQSSDAWVYGAVDPNSARGMWSGPRSGRAAEIGLKPKRTIVIASWDAEEEGLIGSTEWGEDHAQELGNAAAISIWTWRCRQEIRRVGRSHFEGIHPRDRKIGAFSARRDGVRRVEKSSARVRRATIRRDSQLPAERSAE